MVAVNTPIKPITPPTTLKIPKSSAPSICNVILAVYSDTTVVKIIRKYRYKVFFRILLLFDACPVNVFLFSN